jgi:hypothetical protein
MTIGSVPLFCSGAWLHARQAVVASTHGRCGFGRSPTGLRA